MNRKIGFYPIVDTADAVWRLLNMSVKTVQIRIKNHFAVENHIEHAIEYGRRFNAQVFINDYWELAIQHGAFGVHLGQQDILKADINAIRAAGLQLGISTHNQEEIENALQYAPDYIGYGPIYHTTTKEMPYEPRGVERLKRVCNQVSCPVVAIGGINTQRLDEVLLTGVDGVAVITAVVDAEKFIKKMHHDEFII